MNKLKELIHKYREILLYLIFGVLTTAVNFSVYTPLCFFMPEQYLLWNVLAWVVAVLFAFFTNKPFVFRSKDWSWKVAGPEFLEFVGCRIGSLIMETVLLWITVAAFEWNEIFMKAVIAVLVVIVNYIGSKLLFKKK